MQLRFTSKQAAIHLKIKKKIQLESTCFKVCADTYRLCTILEPLVIHLWEQLSRHKIIHLPSTHLWNMLAFQMWKAKCRPCPQEVKT